MQQYKEYLERIKKYFEYDEVISDGNIISIYDLICILENYLSKLYNILYNEKQLIAAIEEYYSESKLIGKIFKKISQVNLAKVDFILQRFADGRAYISIYFKDSQIGFTSMTICKEKGTNEMYFGKYDFGKDKEFVSHFRDIILTNLQTIEDFLDIFKLSLPNLIELPSNNYNKDIIKQEIDDDFLRVTIIYDTRGQINYKVDILDSIDKDDIYHREWLDHESIKEYVDKNISELLKRIPVDIDKLELSTQKILSNYYMNKKNGKSLTIKGVSL